jgi:hypothetical protein
MINHIRKELVLLRETHHDEYVSRRVNNALSMLDQMERYLNEGTPGHNDAGLPGRRVDRGVDCDIFRHSMEVMLDGSLD